MRATLLSSSGDDQAARPHGGGGTDRATHVGNEARLLGVLTAAECRALDRVLKSLLIELERAERRS
jgi:hypothetical protein